MLALPSYALVKGSLLIPHSNLLHPHFFPLNDLSPELFLNRNIILLSAECQAWVETAWATSIIQNCNLLVRQLASHYKSTHNNTYSPYLKKSNWLLVFSLQVEKWEWNQGFHKHFHNMHWNSNDSTICQPCKAQFYASRHSCKLMKSRLHWNSCIPAPLIHILWLHNLIIIWKRH